MNRRLAITTGDPDGIGLEVTTKALKQLSFHKDIQWVLFKGKDGWPNDWSKDLPFKFEKIAFENVAQTDVMPSRHLVIEQESSPAIWVKQAAEGCASQIFSGLITAPMSKTVIGGERGHTGILRPFSDVSLHMGFFGPRFNVVLASDHCSLKEVSKQITIQVLHEVFLKAMIFGPFIFNRLFQISDDDVETFVFGLNPHAGEQGLIGHEESATIIPAIKRFSSPNSSLIGPIVPDALVSYLEPEGSKNKKLFIALYHDQGLIPFKLLHGQSSGIQISLGLPFIRTSVDHGTAKDLFGRGVANEGSMLEALEAAISLSEKSELWTQLYKKYVHGLAKIYEAI